MRKLITFLLFFSFFFIAEAQFKEELNNKTSIREGFLSKDLSSNIFGFIDPSKFSMNHSVSMSYSAFAGQGVAMGVYTNSMRYDFNSNLNVQVDASIVNSPYNTLGDGFKNSINGIYLSRAAINYKPSENTAISIQFRQGPGAYYNSYYSPYYLMSPSFDRETLFHAADNQK
jgi:hypothetical protein